MPSLVQGDASQPRKEDLSSQEERELVRVTDAAIRCKDERRAAVAREWEEERRREAEEEERILIWRDALVEQATGATLRRGLGALRARGTDKGAPCRASRRRQ